MTTAELDFSKLSVDGKLDLIGRIWDSISPDEFAISDALFDELEKDRAEYLQNPNTGTTIQELGAWINKNDARP